MRAATTGVRGVLAACGLLLAARASGPGARTDLRQRAGDRPVDEVEGSVQNDERAAGAGQ